MPAGSNRRVTFVETLGKGGFGAVYLVDVHGREDFVQRLALKVLHAEKIDQGTFAARQRDEARLLAQLNHANIVKVMDLVELDGRPAVFMEYVEGIDARTLLRQGPFPPRAALQMAAAVASALDAAYNQPGPRSGEPLKVIHRDVKPANVLVSVHGAVKVLDFGIARAAIDREGETSDEALGTLRYMSPELVLRREPSHAVDVYGLGLTLYEALAGKTAPSPPLDPDAYGRHVDGLLEALPHNLGPAARAPLLALLRSMLAWDPLDRPPAAQVEDRCLDLAHAARGIDIAKWAKEQVPPLVAERRKMLAEDPRPDPISVTYATIGGAALEPDDLPESTKIHERPTTPTGTSPTTKQTLVFAAAGGGLVAAVGAALVVLAAGAWWWLAAHPSEEAAEAEAPSVEVVAAPPARLPAPEEAPEATGAAPVRHAKPQSATPPPAAPTSAPTQPPATASAEEAPAPAAAPEAVVTRPITFSSVPMGAMVVLDGKPLGATPLSDVAVPQGDHTVRMESGTASIERSIKVGRRSPGRYVWTVGDGTWLAGY